MVYRLYIAIFIVVPHEFFCVMTQIKNFSQKMNEDVDADAFGRDIISLQLNTKGKFDSILAAPYLLHFPKDDISNILQPNMTLFVENKMPWQILLCMVRS